MADAELVTRAGHAQWTILDLGQTSMYKESDAFKIGKWKWHLSIERNQSVFVRLFPVSPEEQPPIARFFLCVTFDGKNTSTVYEGLLRTCDDFAFPVVTSQSQFVIDVEFWNLKICHSNGGKDISVWPNEDMIKPILATRSSHRWFSRMLNESFLTDVTINTANGKLLAHKAVLSASSPIFHNMFVDVRELSTIDIKDMTSEICMAFLSFIYGTINHEDFWKHRVALLFAAIKYDISDLKDACEDSLLQGINLDNVFERIEEARLYKLNKLKNGCIKYLLDFGKKYDIREALNDFLRKGDKELVLEMFDEVLAVLYQA